MKKIAYVLGGGLLLGLGAALTLGGGKSESLQILKATYLDSSDAAKTLDNDIRTGKYGPLVAFYVLEGEEVPARFDARIRDLVRKANALEKSRGGTQAQTIVLVTGVRTDPDIDAAPEGRMLLVIPDTPTTNAQTVPIYPIVGTAEQDLASIEQDARGA